MNKQQSVALTGQAEAEAEAEAEAAAAQDQSDEDQRSSSTSTSSGYSSLMDENKRLKKENGVLNTELSTMKKKCKELLDLVANCASTEKEEYEGPKLFGVRLEVQGEMEKKRKRAEISESASIILSQACK